MLDTRSLRHFDARLAGLVVALCLVGILMVHSSARPLMAGKGGMSPLVLRQLVWLGLGFGIVALLACLDYGALRRYERLLYAVTLLTLLVVLVASSGKGASRWFNIAGLGGQPSEFAKVFVLIALANHLDRNRHLLSDWRVLGRSFLYIVPPLLLVLLQPNLSTSLAFLVIWFGMAAMAGARWWHLAGVAAGLLVLAVVAWHTPLVREYQKARFEVLFHPQAAEPRSAYQLEQSKIAIGSGGVWGRGYGQGRQSQLSFVPEQQTDFIFTIVAEELGFVGAAIVLVLYLLLIWQAIGIVAGSHDAFGALVGTGAVCLLGFHVFVNVGMTMGVLPVTGLPLPFLSYGGSNLLTSMMLIGLLMSIHMRRHKIRF